MIIKSFEDVIAWQKAKELNLCLYSKFQDHKDKIFRTQLLRASLSIMNNIAEGFDRGSNKELKYFLVVARGSSAEVRSMLILAKDLDYMTKNEFDELLVLSKDISKLLTGFIKSVSDNSKQRTGN